MNSTVTHYKITTLALSSMSMIPRSSFINFTNWAVVVLFANGLLFSMEVLSSTSTYSIVGSLIIIPSALCFLQVFFFRFGRLRCLSFWGPLLFRRQFFITTWIMPVQCIASIIAWDRERVFSVYTRTSVPTADPSPIVSHVEVKSVLINKDTVLSVI